MHPKISSQILQRIIHEPTLTLYGFHQRTDITQSPTSNNLIANRFWEQLRTIGKTLGISELRELLLNLDFYNNPNNQPEQEREQENQYISLLQDGIESLDFSIPTQNASPKLQGFLSPFCLHDIYGIDFTTVCTEFIKVEQIYHLNPQNQLIPPYLQPSLGSTFVLFGKTKGTQSYKKELADCCTSLLFPAITSLKFIATGKLLNNSIFEYSVDTDSSVQMHLLVWFEHQPISDLGKISEHLLHLFSFRHKIIYTYNQARICYEQAREMYSVLEKDIHGFHILARSIDRLQQFQQWLIELPQRSLHYNCLLRDLTDYETTIETNLENYRRQLEKIALFPGCDLGFLESFAEQVEKKYLRQIQINRAYLTPGKDLFQQLSGTILGLVEIDQAEGDRRLERTIQVVGVGLGVGALVSVGADYWERPFYPPFSTKKIHPFILLPLLSLMVAFLASFITWWITRPNSILLSRKNKKS